ncbi:MAG: alpha/beta fold hydrolase, partial [Stackebrandtia sp.]
IVSQLIAAQAPQRVRRLVLVGTGASTAGNLPGFAAAVERWTSGIHHGHAASRAAVEETVAMLFSSPPTHTEWDTYIDAVMRADPAYLAAVLGKARELDLTSRLPAITASTLIVRGTEDCARTAEHARALAAGIPDSRSVEMTGAGHSPMVDHPADFNRLIADHLGD